MMDVADDTDVRRDRIIHYATRAFMRQGFEEAGLDEVAAEAHVSKPTIYRLFGNKEGLLRAVILQAVADMIDSIQISFDPAEEAEEVLTAFARQYITGMYRKVAGGQPFFMLSRLMIAASLDRPDLATQFVDIFSQAVGRKLQPTFVRLLRFGAVHPDDGMDMVSAFLHAIFYTNHAILNASAPPSDEQIAQQARARVRLFLYGCHAQADARLR